jgi:DNA mismatch endonuclease, patch repair protein
VADHRPYWRPANTALRSLVLPCSSQAICSSATPLCPDRFAPGVGEGARHSRRRTTATGHGWHTEALTSWIYRQKAMADNHTPEQRSANMARIRSSGTTPEERLYVAVRTVLGHRWRIDRNVTAMVGRPDLVIPSLRLVIFADGCFFHGCPAHYRVPLSNSEYWQPKIAGNIQRDSIQRNALEADGWTVWRVWEHDLTKKTLPDTQLSLGDRLEQRVAERPGRSSASYRC